MTLLADPLELDGNTTGLMARSRTSKPVLILVTCPDLWVVCPHQALSPQVTGLLDKHGNRGEGT